MWLSACNTSQTIDDPGRNVVTTVTAGNYWADMHLAPGAVTKDGLSRHRGAKDVP